MAQKNSRSSWAERVAWLKSHPEMWAGIELYLHGSRMICKHRPDHIRVARRMKEAGLFAKSTYVMDIPVGELVRSVRE